MFCIGNAISAGDIAADLTTVCEKVNLQFHFSDTYTHLFDICLCFYLLIYYVQ